MFICSMGHMCAAHMFGCKSWPPRTFWMCVNLLLSALSGGSELLSKEGSSNCFFFTHIAVKSDPCISYHIWCLISFLGLIALFSRWFCYFKASFQLFLKRWYLFHVFTNIWKFFCPLFFYFFNVILLFLVFESLKNILNCFRDFFKQLG